MRKEDVGKGLGANFAFAGLGLSTAQFFLSPQELHKENPQQLGES